MSSVKRFSNLEMPGDWVGYPSFCQEGWHSISLARPRCNAKAQGIGLWCPRGLELNQGGETNFWETRWNSYGGCMVQGYAFFAGGIPFQQPPESGSHIWTRWLELLKCRGEFQRCLSDCSMTGTCYLCPVSWCGKWFSGVMVNVFGCYVYFLWAQLWRGFVSFLVL